jgi:allantoin racemase
LIEPGRRSNFIDMPTLLVINPNTTAAVTELVAGHVRQAVGDRVGIVAATGRMGCAYISSEACYCIAEYASLECYAELGQACDGVLLACFGDPGLFALREVCPVPVTGLAEACMQASAARVKAFSIVTGGARWRPMLHRLAATIGLAHALASVRTIAFTGGQIAADPEAALDLLGVACEAAAREDGAEEVILGGAGLAGLAERIQSRCSIPIHDSVQVAARIAVQRMADGASGSRVEYPVVDSRGVHPALGKLLT